jgi:hypothetical protein
VKFDDLQMALASAPGLALRDFGQDNMLRTDASDVAIVGVLAQMQPWGPEGRLVERAQGFISGKLHPVEKRYTVYNHELLAIRENLIYW